MDTSTAVDKASAAEQMTEEEAAAVLLALGDPIAWRDDGAPTNRSYAMIDFYEDVGGFVEVSYSIHFDTWFEQWQMIHKPTYQRTWCKTLPEAKTACEHHRATGTWPAALQVQEGPLEWMQPTNDGGRWIKRSERPKNTAIGRGISYAIFERKRLWRTLHWEVRYCPHQCRTVDGRIVTVEKEAPSDLPLCYPEPGATRQYDSHTAAESACEHHHATGTWE